ncbi:MAG: hypothetical protein WD688_21475 [Candidatus Binatia bacterium]
MADAEIVGEGSACRPTRSDSGLVDIKTLNMIKVIITGGKSRQVVAPDKSSVYGVSGKQMVARHQVIGGPQDSLVQGKDSQESKQSKGLVKVHFLPRLSVALEVAQHTFGSNLLVYDDPGAEINEQSF